MHPGWLPFSVPDVCLTDISQSIEVNHQSDSETNVAEPHTESVANDQNPLNHPAVSAFYQHTRKQELVDPMPVDEIDVAWWEHQHVDIYDPRAFVHALLAQRVREHASASDMQQAAQQFIKYGL